MTTREQVKQIWHDKRIYFVGAGLTAVVFLALAGFAYNLVQLRAEINRRPPLSYISTSQPENLTVCPGERFTYGFSLDVLEVPAVVRIYKSVWSYDLSASVVAAKAVDTNSYVWVVLSNISREASYTLPLETDAGKPFAPGRYALFVGATSEGKGTDAFSIPFTVPDRADCPTARTQRDPGELVVVP